MRDEIKHTTKKLPLTRLEFEIILEEATSKQGLPYDDNMRVMAISFFHSLGRETSDFDPDKLEKYLYTAVSHDMTYHIGQEIHEKRTAEKLAAEAKKTELTVVEPV